MSEEKERTVRQGEVVERRRNMEIPRGQGEKRKKRKSRMNSQCRSSRPDKATTQLKLNPADVNTVNAFTTPTNI